MTLARRGSWQAYVSSINQSLSLHDVWKSVQRINGRYSPAPRPVLKDPTGTFIGDPAQVADTLAEHFAHISSDAHYSPTFLRHKARQELHAINFNTADHFPYNDAISHLEFLSALSATAESSPSMDGITYSMLKHCDPSLHNAILHLYNSVFLEGLFPEDWRVATVIPIQKPNKDPFLSENYRPISLTSCLCKVLEKIVNSRLMWFLESRNIIDTAQSGFRRNRSTTDHLVRLEQDLRQAISDGHHTLIIFFDIMKAYDTAWRHNVLQKLHDYGLRGPLPLFISNFLRNRHLRVRVGSTLSEPQNFSQGIPQGSVLSCTCFLVALNDLPLAIPRNVQSMLYVDDLTIYMSGPSLRHLERQLQLALNSLLHWSDTSGFQFSPAKTVSMHICRKRNCPKLAPNLTLADLPLRCVPTHKFLGMTLDSGLTWRSHLTALKTACHRVLDLFKKLSHTSWGSDSVTLLRLYVMLLKPKIEYGLEAYSSAADSYILSIGTIQNSAIRFATGAFRSTPVASLHAETSLLPQPYARQQKLLNYFLRLYVNSVHPLHDWSIDYDDLFDPALADTIPASSFLGLIYDLLIQYDLDLSLMLTEPMPRHPPWRISKISICDDLEGYSKRDVPHSILKRVYLDHMHTHNNSVTIYTDGSRTDDGVAFAIHCTAQSRQVRLNSLASVYTAELLAIREAIMYAETTVQSNTITIATDSRSAIQAIGSLNLAHPIVNHIRDQLIVSEKSYSLCWVPSHVGVPGNERADLLARDAITTLPVTPLSLPRSDLKCYIRRMIRLTWGGEWRRSVHNKLREILPNIPGKYVNHHPRSWSVKLTRLRVGHCRATHGYLMNQDPPPYCMDCIVPLTVRHILLECPSYMQHRHLFGCPGPPLLSDIFSKDNSVVNGPLHTYLLRIGMFNEI